MGKYKSERVEDKILGGGTKKIIEVRESSGSLVHDLLMLPDEKVGGRVEYYDENGNFQSAEEWGEGV